MEKIFLLDNGVDQTHGPLEIKSLYVIEMIIFNENKI